jgi:hypothetical protein
LHHSFLSFPNGSDAQILNDFQKHQTVFVSFLSDDGREADASRIAGNAALISEECRGRASIASAEQFCQNISSAEAYRSKTHTSLEMGTSSAHRLGEPHTSLP